MLFKKPKVVNDYVVHLAKSKYEYVTQKEAKLLKQIIKRSKSAEAVIIMRRRNIDGYIEEEEL